MADDNVLDQNEIERLLSGMGGGAADPSPPDPPAPAPADGGGLLGQDELDALFAAAGGGGAAASTPSPAVSSGPADSAAVDGPLDQNDIESLFQGAGSKPAAAPPSSPPGPPAAAPPGPSPMAFGSRAPLPAEPGDEDGIQQGDLDYLLKRADEAIDSLATGKMPLPAEVIEFQYPEFGGSVPNTEHATLDQISEVELDVKIELGRTNMYLEDVLKLRKGSVVPLDKMAGDAVDLYVNGRLLARGEVLVMNENFCIRVAELLAGAIPIE